MCVCVCVCVCVWMCVVCVRVCVYTCVDVCLCVHVCGVCLCVCVSLRTLAEKAREFNISLYLSFVDLRKAYGSVNREVLWLLLERKYQFPGEPYIKETKGQ